MCNSLFFPDTHKKYEYLVHVIKTKKSCLQSKRRGIITVKTGHVHSRLNSRQARDGPERASRDQILRRERRAGKFHSFLFSLPQEGLEIIPVGTQSGENDGHIYVYY